MVRFFAVLALLLLIISLQAKFPMLRGWLGDIPLIYLIAAGAFFSFWEVGFLSVIAAFFLVWRPSISFEIIFLLAVPAFLTFLRPRLPWRAPAASFIFTVSAIAVLYGTTAGRGLLGDPAGVLAVLALDSAAAFFIFYLLSFLFANPGRQALRYY